MALPKGAIPPPRPFPRPSAPEKPAAAVIPPKAPSPSSERMGTGALSGAARRRRQRQRRITPLLRRWQRPMAQTLRPGSVKTSGVQPPETGSPKPSPRAADPLARLWRRGPQVRCQTNALRERMLATYIHAETDLDSLRG